jgi:hypothetical protein
MKQSGTNDTGQRIHNERLQQHRLVKANLTTVDKYPVRQNTRQHQKQEIKNDNAPIR